MADTDERHPRDPIVILTEAISCAGEVLSGEQLTELRSVRTHFNNLRIVAGLVCSAAAKHTAAGRHDRDRDRGAVGRLHNAAKNARRALDAGACAMCKDAGDSGIDVMKRSGTCAECGRVLGDLRTEKEATP